MGSGIAQVCAVRGLDVVLSDRTKDLLDFSLASVRKALQRQVNKGSLPADAAKEALERIRIETSLEVRPWCTYSTAGSGMLGHS
jgi:3-hydroxybutyryl-CoA dehydrogenase